MDPERSESAHQAEPIGPVTLTIKQTPASIVIETRRSNPRRTLTQTEILTFKLDGTETTTPGRNGVPVKTRAHWNGSDLVAETERNIEAASITTMYVYTLDPKGQEITVHKSLTVQHGYQFEGAKNTGTGIDVFVRTKAAKAGR